MEPRQLWQRLNMRGVPIRWALLRPAALPTTFTIMATFNTTGIYEGTAGNLFNVSFVDPDVLFGVLTRCTAFAVQLFLWQPQCFWRCSARPFKFLTTPRNPGLSTFPKTTQSLRSPLPQWIGCPFWCPVKIDQIEENRPPKNRHPGHLVTLVLSSHTSS